MNVLILGGTKFAGRAMVDSLLARGHQVTLFNRGQTNPGLFTAVEQIHGDRSTDLDRLSGRRWDAVIDTSGYFPRDVRAAARRLAGSVGQYIFISSLSVYASSGHPNDEDSPVAQLPAGQDPDSMDSITNDNYGPLKVLCEQAVEASMPGQALILRPGLIVGPHDPTDRFSYWPHRVDRGGEVLAPGRPARTIQWIDVRDLADWTTDLIEKNRTGIFNAIGPAVPHSMLALLETCQAVSGANAAFTWVSEDFLLEREVGPWMELPLWVPESDPEFAGFFSHSNRRAIEAGLLIRPLSDTVRATLEWLKTRPADHQWRAGMASEREQTLLEEWHKVSNHRHSG